MTLNTHMLAVLVAGSVSATGAAIVESHTDTFSGGGGSSAAGGKYTLVSADVSLFTLERAEGGDGALFDGADDGYAWLRKTSSKANNIVTVSLGTVEAADVGQQIEIDAGICHLGSMTSEWKIKLDGDELEGVCKRVSSYRKHAMKSNTPVLLSTIDQDSDEGDTPGMAGALAYLIQSADVGKELSLEISVYDPSEDSHRALAIDSISYYVASQARATLGLIYH